MESDSAKFGCLRKISKGARACVHEAVAFAGANVCINSTSPESVVLANLAQMGGVVATALAGAYASGTSVWAKKVETFFQDTINPNITSALFTAVNGGAGLLEWTGAINRSVSMEESRMKFLIGALGTGFFCALGAKESSKIKGWLARRGKLINLLANSEIYVAPQLPIFYSVPLANLGEKLGSVAALGHEVPVLTAGLWGFAGAALINGIRNARSSKKPGFFSRNMGMLGCASASVTVLGQSVAMGGVSPHLLAASGLLSLGMGIFLVKDWRRGNAAPVLTSA